MLFRSRITQAGGHTMTMRWDGADRVVSRSSDGRTVEWGYDGDGRRVRMRPPTGRSPTTPTTGPAAWSRWRIRRSGAWCTSTTRRGEWCRRPPRTYIEIALKLIAVGPLRFFRSGWNTFDFLVVVVVLVLGAGPLSML